MRDDQHAFPVSRQLPRQLLQCILKERHEVIKDMCSDREAELLLCKRFAFLRKTAEKALEGQVADGYKREPENRAPKAF